MCNVIYLGFSSKRAFKPGTVKFGNGWVSDQQTILGIYSNLFNNAGGQ